MTSTIIDHGKEIHLELKTINLSADNFKKM